MVGGHRRGGPRGVLQARDGDAPLRGQVQPRVRVRQVRGGGGGGGGEVDAARAMVRGEARHVRLHPRGPVRRTLRSLSLLV